MKCFVLVCALLMVGVIAVPTSIPSLPSVAQDFVMETAQGKAYAFLESETAVYDPAAGNWKVLAAAVKTTTAGSAVVNDTVFILGGGGKAEINKCSAFVVSKGQFEYCKPMPSARAWLGVTALNGIVYAVGGWAASGWNRAEAYNVGTEEWNVLPMLPTPRYGLMLEAVNDKVYAIGGSAWHAPATPVVEVFSPSTQTWSKGPSMAQGIAFGASVTMGDNIYVIGGENGMAAVQTVQVFSSTSLAWQIIDSIGTPTAHLAAAVIDSWILVAGGVVGSGQKAHAVPYAEAYTPQ